MTSLTAIFGNSQGASGDSEKLLELYWNRAELKKEFASLREETFKLKDQVKNREGETARLQQKLEHLENLLLDPEWVYSVVVHYQLRALNQRLKTMLARFAEQLKQQREQKQHRKLLETWNRERQAEADAVVEQIEDLRMRTHLLEDQLQAERHRFSMMGGIARFFRKRSVKRILDGISSDLAAAQEQESVLAAALAEVRARKAPDTRGLDVASKRSINFMILAFAQQIFLHFAEDELASLAKEAGDKSVGALRYGDRESCEFLLERIAKRAGSMEKAGKFAEVLQHRARLLSETARYSSPDDAVPVSETVATLYDIDGNGAVSKASRNLLGENYWDLARILSR